MKVNSVKFIKMKQLYTYDMMILSKDKPTLIFIKFVTKLNLSNKSRIVKFATGSTVKTILRPAILT